MQHDFAVAIHREFDRHAGFELQGTKDEEQRLRSPEYRAQLVETLVRAIGRFKLEYETGSVAPAGPP